MEKNEKRSRKRSRKVSESEQAQEEPPSPVGKTRRRSATGRFAPAEETSGRAISSRTRNKVLKVSFDILENNLNVGDAAEGVNGSQCSLTLASAPENTPTPGTENHENRIRPGNGAGSKNKRDIVRKSPEIKFKNNNFNVSVKLPNGWCTIVIWYVQFSYLSSNKKRSWKSYKQIVTAERALPWRPSDVTCE